MFVELKTGPVVRAVSLISLKSHLKVSDDDENLLTEILDDATSALELWLGRSFISQTWELTLEGKEFPPSSDIIRLPHGPLISVTSVKWWDTDGDEQTFSSGSYTVHTGKGSKIFLNNGAAWPSGVRWRKSAVIEYISGDGTASSGVPGNLRLAIRMLVGHYYINREVTSIDSLPQEIILGLNQLTNFYNNNAEF